MDVLVRHHPKLAGGLGICSDPGYFCEWRAMSNSGESFFFLFLALFADLKYAFVTLFAGKVRNKGEGENKEGEEEENKW